MKYCLSILSVLGVLLTHAQINVSGLHNSESDLENSFYNASMIGQEYRTMKISLLPLYFHIGNNFTSAADIYDYYRDLDKGLDANSMSSINRIMKGLKNKNQIYAGLDLTLVNIGFNLKVKKKKFLELNFAAREHLQAGMVFNKELLYLMYKGNAYYEDQTIDILPKVNVLQCGDFSVAAAKEFSLKLPFLKNLLSVKPGIRLRYLVGTANLNMQNSSLSIYTAPEGRYIEATLNGDVKACGFDPDQYKSVDGALFKGNGQGFGVDLGVTVKMLDKLEVGLALFDNGSITFKDNAYQITSNETVRWEGYDFNQPIDTLFEQSDLLELDSAKTSYAVPIGSKLMLSGRYGLGKEKKIGKSQSYYAHTISFLYIQGFRNYLNTTTSPLVSLGYSYQYRHAFNFGINAGVGGLTRSFLGAHMHLGLGPVKFGFATNSLGAIVNRYASKGMDLQIYTALSF
ncbi:MAG: hypothetical protein JNJ58_11555 [Chitinophagaceae bacterium]|nr:hypothetical protein [Chitinophagaceae bacterium]